MPEWDYPKYQERPTRYMRHEVVLCNAEEFDADFPPQNASEFFEWLGDLIAQVPEDFRETARIEFESVSGYEGSSYAHVKVSYRRPETDEELAARVADYERVTAARDKHERAELERLQRKFAAQA